MRLKFFVLIILAIFLSGEAYAKNLVTTAPQKKKVSVVNKKRTRRILKYVSPPEKELQVETIPLVLPISEDVALALSKNDIDQAIRTLRTEPPSSKSIHLLREAQKIAAIKKTKAPKIDKHQYYQNIGIAYHNLALFLKRYNMTNEKLYKSALKYYKKASHSKSPSEKYETEILSASAMASMGEVEKAKKLFGKVDLKIVEDEYRSIEYIATYYAAINDVDKTAEMLKKAYEVKPEDTALWVAISDDFTTVENDPLFKNLVNQWKVSQKKEGPNLTVPKTALPKLK